MKKEITNTVEATLLRQIAEEQLKKKQAGKAPPTTEGDAVRLLHELEVHQVELEMQNEELRRAIDKAEAATEEITILYDFAPAAYFTLDKDSLITNLNLNGAKMLGRDRSDLIKNNFKMFISLDTREIFDEFFQDLIETYSKHSCEIKLVTHENRSIYVQLDGIVSESKKKYLLSAIDITELKRVEEELRKSETIAGSRLREIDEIYQNAPIGLGVFDLDLRFLRINEHLAKINGIPVSEHIGKTIEQLVPVFFEQARSIRDTILKTGKPQIGLEVTGYTPSKPGILRSWDENWVPLHNDAGDIVGISIVVEETTERKLAEKILKENEERLRDLNATKDKFFSIISHDLRSPFTAIIGYSELLADQIDHKNYEGIEEYAKVIQLSSWRAMDFLSNLLEWARSQTGIMGFNPQIIDITKIINEIANLLKDSAIQKSIDIKVKIPQSFSIYADISMIKTILRNLISNSIKFTNPGGVIVIESSYTDSVSIVSVSDNGIGIKKDTIEKLFRIEESRSTAGTKGEQGTGLGLLLCNDFVKKHGGNIWVESEHGKGSSFYFTIPDSKVPGNNKKQSRPVPTK